MIRNNNWNLLLISNGAERGCRWRALITCASFDAHVIVQLAQCACALNFIRGSGRTGTRSDREEFVVNSTFREDKKNTNIFKMSEFDNNPFADTASENPFNVSTRTEIIRRSRWHIKRRQLNGSQHARKLVGWMSGRGPTSLRIATIWQEVWLTGF